MILENIKNLLDFLQNNLWVMVLFIVIVAIIPPLVIKIEEKPISNEGNQTLNPEKEERIRKSQRDLKSAASSLIITSILFTIFLFFRSN